MLVCTFFQSNSQFYELYKLISVISRSQDMENNGGNISNGEQLREISKEIIEVYRQLHMNPQIGMQEYHTTKYLHEFVKKIQGVEIIVPSTEITGLVCKVSPLEKKFVENQQCLFRCDIDALGFQEGTDLEYKSTNGLHHACGHDGHTTMMLFAVREIAKRRSLLQRTIIFCFQPGEQGKGGARKLLNAHPNLLNNVKHCFAIHVANHKVPETLLIPREYVTCNSNRFTLQIIGKAAHVMQPQIGVDANYIGCQIVQYIYGLRSRLSPMDNIIISVTKINGGKVPNAISDTFTASGPLRTFNLQIHSSIQQKLQKYVKSICETEGATYKLKFTDINYRAVKNQENAIKIVKNNAQELFNTIDFVGPSMAGQDFSQFSEKVPSCYFILGVALPDSIDSVSEQSIFPIHSPKFLLNEEALWRGTALWVKLALSSNK